MQKPSYEDASLSTLMTPTKGVCRQVDESLEQGGWTVQFRFQVHLYGSYGVAFRDAAIKTRYADHLQLAHGSATAVEEAEPKGGILPESKVYPGTCCQLAKQQPLPFGCQSPGTETWFIYHLNPYYISCQLFTFKRRKTLGKCVAGSSQRHQRMSPYSNTRLLPARAEASRILEISPGQNRRRIPLQMTKGLPRPSPPSLSSPARKTRWN